MHPKRLRRVVLFLLVSGLAGQATTAPAVLLKTRLERMAADFRGEVGIYVHHPARGLTLSIHGDDLFPTASMVKIPIMIGIYDRIEKGELSLDSTLIFHRDSIHYPWKGGDAVARFAEGEDITLGKLLAHSITFSDNYASIWLQQLAGTGTAINAWLADHGWEQTRVNSRTPGRQSNWEEYGWGQSTPEEMARFLLALRRGNVVSPRASEDMYRYLCRSYWDGEALSQIPPWVQAASKQGAVDEARSEVVLVNAPHGDYVFCVMTNHQTDQSWGIDNEGFVLIRRVSRLLWQTFEPESDWRPAPGMEAFWK
ncbi:MAG: serine hydrolase [Candidatus Neomarinimicrobiota bacterium]|nr:MAG: serine hydrolase [Candidatus Neomarinimicrobiota bacterium]